MEKFKRIVSGAAICVFVICFYSFLNGNEVFKGKFSNDAIAWYFLAKGIFCSVSMYVLVCILESLRKKS